MLMQMVKKIIGIYQKSTKDFLPTQRKLLLIVVVSFSLFLLFDLISIVKFFMLHNDPVFRVGALIYAQRNFMLPHPSMFSSFNKEWAVYAQYSFGSINADFKPLWQWYSDEVILSGAVFFLSSILLITSIIIGKVISEQSEKQANSNDSSRKNN